MGSINAALTQKKPLLVMPRMKRFKEHVNDHQVDIAKKFEENGHLLVAYDRADLPDCLQRLKNFVPKERVATPHKVADRLRRFLDSI
jgi:UDP-N-acetylglucosamine transferase subunit ALG13